jgi:hypothetical protein
LSSVKTIARGKGAKDAYVLGEIPGRAQKLKIYNLIVTYK